MITASAPGKLVLMGEYAVLHGHSAVVAAVNVRATCRRSRGPLEIERDRGGLVDACLGIAGEVDGSIVLDTSPFRAGDAKYGLGSSAAACVSLLRALWPLVQQDELHRFAQRAHRSFQQGRGSGVDICAAVYGGIQRFVRCDDEVTEVKALPPLLSDVTLLLVWTGAAADTRAFLQQVEKVKTLQSFMNELGAASLGFQNARDPDDLFVAVHTAHEQLRDLGAAAGVHIVSEVHQRIAAIARRYGGAGKPSGAGGGDVALCFIPREAQATCADDLRSDGHIVLDLSVGAPGVDVVGDL